MADKSIGKDETVMPGGGGEEGYDLAAGDVLESYEIVKPLGRGGMGQVYLAENRVSGRRVALKLLPADATGAGFVERFRIESRVMSDLDHPGIVRVHHAGSDKGRYYLTMDYVAGEDGEALTLADVLEDGRGQRSEVRGQEEKGEQGERRTSNVEHRTLNEEQIRDIALQICDALAYAHGKGIVHRDLKPANILLETGAPVAAPAGHKGSSTPHSALRIPHYKIRITDFGLAKVVGEDFVSAMVKKSISISMGRSIGEGVTEPGSSKRAAYEGTSTGALLGTYDYMSPEQKAGGEVTKQSDIYALGVILYRMLTGRKPEGRFRLPSELGRAKGWDAIINNCLEYDFQDRYADVGEVRVALEGLRHGRRRSSYKGAWARRESERPTKSRLGKAAGWVLVLGLLGFAGWWGLARDRRADPLGPQTEPSPVPLAVTELEPRQMDPEPEPTPVLSAAERLALEIAEVERRIQEGREERGAEGEDEVFEDALAVYRVLEGESRRLEAFEEEQSKHYRRDSEVLVRIRDARAANRREMEAAWTRVEEAGKLRYEAEALKLAEMEAELQSLLEFATERHPSAVEKRSKIQLQRETLAELLPYVGRGEIVVLDAVEGLKGRFTGEHGEEVGLEEALAEGLPGMRIWRYALWAEGFRNKSGPLGWVASGRRVELDGVLERQQGAVRVVLEVPGHAREFFRTSEVEVRVGSEVRNARGQAEWTLEGLPVGEVDVGVQSSRFRVQGSGSVEVRDGETAMARFALQPLPASVALTGLPDGASARLSDGSAVSDLSDIVVPSLQEVILLVRAPRYREATVRVAPLQPGQQRDQAVRMERIPGPEEGETWRLAALGLEMVWIPAGHFMMGSTAAEREWAAGPEGKGEARWFATETDPRRVEIGTGFWMGRTTVTVAMLRRFVEATGYRTYAERVGEARTMNQDFVWGNVAGKSWRDPGLPGYRIADNHPVVCVSWNDAMAFCRWLTETERAAGRLPEGYEYRLPGEAEWEYAARGGRQGTRFWWGDSVADGRGRANVAGTDRFPDELRRNWSSWDFSDGFAFLSPVDHYGARGRNGFGLADMLGNVWEWCYDAETGRAQSTIAKGDAVSRRVLRGGSFCNQPGYLRCANRDWSAPTRASADGGFRVVLGEIVR